MMCQTSFHRLLVSFAVGAAIAAWPVDRAEACGGCFHIAQSQNATVVTGHRMVLSVSQKQTTLYDQISYSGAPGEFAWVLPIKGTATVGLSSDLLFQLLDAETTVQIHSPEIHCGSQTCDSGAAKFAGNVSAVGVTSAGSGMNGVQVLAQETVGPYETVQLASSDPGALDKWLASHGYAVPSDVKPVLAAYVAEKFNFLAMKLVPGAGVQAMRPVRVTSAGAGPALPLRMVAAGTGATTTITLWVVGEGRYQTKSAPWFTISADELVWNWDTKSSNYAALRQQRYDASGGVAWLVEAAKPASREVFAAAMVNAAKYNPAGSGYDAGMAPQQAQQDVDALFGSIASESAWITRLRADLGRKAFESDLTLEAAGAQEPVLTDVFISQTTGTAPSCPDCSKAPGAPGGCAAGGEGALDWPVLAGALLGLVAASRRRR